MKKAIVVAVLMVFGAGGVLAQTGEVYSLNVVGFQKLTAVSQGLVLVSAPFERSPNTLDDVVGPQLTGGKSEGSADLIATWDSAAQMYRRYWLKSSDGKWYAVGGGAATNVYIEPSDAFWLQNRRTTNQTVIVSGDVVDSAAVTNVLVPGLNLVSYPFSAPVDLNSSALTNGKAGKSEGVADLVAIWNAMQQQYVRYWLRSSDKKWCTVGSSSPATNVFIGGGVGFWYQNRATSNFVWVETRPYSL